MEPTKTKSAEARDREKAQAKSGFLIGVIFGGLIFAMIAGMLVFDAYGEKVTARGAHPPVDAAEH